MLIKLRDYQRIYSTVNSILLNEKADLTVACMYYSVFGAYVLKKHYKIDAAPVSGLAAYNVGGKNNILTFGEIQNENLVSTSNAFHCWIEANGWLIDFMAPVFPEIIKKSEIEFSCEPKMLQKPLESMNSSAYDLLQEGDFYVKKCPLLTAEKLKHFTTSLAFGDLAEICVSWYKKPPKKMISKIRIQDGKGMDNEVILTGKKLKGAW